MPARLTVWTQLLLEIKNGKDKKILTDLGRVRVRAAVAKAAAARFMPDSADEGLPVPVFWNNFL